MNARTGWLPAARLLTADPDIGQHALVEVCEILPLPPAAIPLHKELHETGKLIPGRRGVDRGD